ncbi:MAG: glucose-1-phosphate adenylyltransferase family protein [Candidatus Sumerlaeaceae bacterium]
MMKKVVALVLAGGKTGLYGVLTRNRAKGALTFASHYRIIDFTLSNLKNSGIEQIGLVIQYLPASLIEHVGVGLPWDLYGYGRCLKIMPPFVGVETTAWYKGTADALWQNWNFIEDCNPEHIVVLSGEHVYHLDFRPVLNFHCDMRADVTMITCDLLAEQRRSRFGYVFVGENSRIERFIEKPDVPPDTCTSTGMYVFRREVLEELLRENARDTNHNLAKHVLEPRVHTLNSYAYCMPGTWDYMENVIDYFDTQMRMLHADRFAELQSWGILTNLEFRDVGVAPATRITSAANVVHSFLGPKCLIEGTVENSIVSPGVQVERGATVRHCILMHDCIVGEGAQLEYVISDRDAVFGARCRVGESTLPQPPDPARGPLTLIGKAARIEPGAVVPQGHEVNHRQVYP